MKVQQRIPRLEEFLRAPKDGFLEICGLAGTGKTKIMMDACCRLAISSGPPVLFIDTEGGFNAQCFEAIVAASTSNDRTAKRVLEKVHVCRVFDCLELQSVISGLCDRMACHSRKELPFSAIFVDSIAFPFRCDSRRLQDCCGPTKILAHPSKTGPRSSLDAGVVRGRWSQMDVLAGERLPALTDIAKWLRDLARHQIAVVVSNHLTETNGMLVPALGHVWTERPARRILLERISGRRRATVTSDISNEGAQVDFQIFQAGVQDEHEMNNGDASSMGSDHDDLVDVDIASGWETKSEDTCSNHSSLDDTLENSEHVTQITTLESQSDPDGLIWPPSWWISRPAPDLIASSRLLPLSRERQSLINSIPLFGNLFKDSSFSGIMEICGEAGTGKTQLCLQSMSLALIAETQRRPKPMLSGAGCVCYLYDQHAPVNRLEEIVAASVRDACNGPTARMVLNSIFMEMASTPEDLYIALCSKVPALHEKRRIRLLVIDSFAAPFRQESMNFMDRSVQLFRITALLKRISTEFDIPILLTNQVMADLNIESKMPGENVIKPALGHAWAFCIEHRITLHRSDRSHMRLDDLQCALRAGHNAYDRTKSTPLPHRFARVEFSSRIPETTVPFTICEEGLR